MKKVTLEVFIKKCNTLFNNKYDYSLLNESNFNLYEKRDLICPSHGLFNIRLLNHYFGSSCKKCSIESRIKKKSFNNEIFIEKANKIHNFKYNYSKVEYVKLKENVTIICPIHGEFKKRANSHLNGEGCKICKKGIEVNTFERFLEKATRLHGNFYNYDKVIYTENTKNTEKVIITCPVHGDFSQIIDSHLQKKGCNECGKDIKKISQNEFIKRSVDIYKDLFDYSLVKYKNSYTKVKIICKEHGEFLQRPNSHYVGNGCKQCSYKHNNFLKSDWIQKGKNKIGILYLLKCKNENEEFFKFGITFNNIQKRYQSKILMPYDYEIIQEIKSEDLEYIWDLEKTIKEKFKKEFYKPKIYFGGSILECLDIKHKEKINNYFTELNLKNEQK